MLLVIFQSVPKGMEFFATRAKKIVDKPNRDVYLQPVFVSNSRRTECICSPVGYFYEEGSKLNKKDFIAKVADKTDVSKRQAEEVLNAILDGVRDILKKGDKITFVDFGTFSVNKRAAREGRNPQTGKKIKISAKKVPTFKAGKGLKDTVASGK
jgi:DNA-binding protein HU-beta